MANGPKLGLLDLDHDTLYLVLEDLWLTASVRMRLRGHVPGNRAKQLLALSETCRHMREVTSPWMFRQVYNRPGSFWPRSLWKYFQTIHVRDVCRMYAPRPIDIDSLITALPFMLSTRRLVIRLTIPPPNDLLVAAATLPKLESLEFEEARLDSCLPALKRFTCLQRLTMTVVPQVEGTPHPSDVDTHSEHSNITTFLRAVSRNLYYLEIAGDLLSFSTFTSIHWPNLRTFIISGHQPNEPHLPLLSIISGMPRLVDLSLNFSAVYGLQLPPFLFISPSEEVHAAYAASAASRLQSLSLSNVFPEDKVPDYPSSSLTRLRILALKDFILYSEDPIFPWTPYSPLSLQRSFDIVERLVLLVHLVELSLTIIGTPTPELVRAIGNACPGLRVLELEEEQYANVHVQLSSDLESYVEPLKMLRYLRVLRITLRFVKTYTTLQPSWDPEDMVHARAAKFFADRFPLLEMIAFSIRPPGFLKNLPGIALWNRMAICRDVQGKLTKIFQLYYLEHGKVRNLLESIAAETSPLPVW